MKSPGLNSNDGTVYIVAGHGGQFLGGLGGHPVMVFDEPGAYGSVLLDIDGNQITARNIRSDDLITDLFVLVKTSNPSPPAPPTGLTATEISSTEIDLGWTDASNNESTFEVERSTNGPGGPFNPLISLGENTIAHTDTGLTASSEYCRE